MTKRRRQPRKSKRKLHYENIWKRYGLTKQKWQALVRKYGGKCAICRQKKKLMVDHKHVGSGRRGRVRGPLCNNCNVGIGHLKENVKALHNAIAYIKRNKNK